MLKIILSLILFSFLSLTYGSILNTGQTQSYFQGDDGYYKVGKSRSYTRNNEGVIKDNVTGLEWQDNYTDNDGDVPEVNWQEAKNYCSNLMLDGGGWRLPKIKELATLIDYSQDSPSLTPNIFQYSKSHFYLALTTNIQNTSVWSVDFEDGLIYPVTKSDSFYYVRCVRGDALSTVQFSRDDSRGIVEDRVNQLLWQDDYSDNYDGIVKDEVWSEAIDYCESLSLGGFGDWRLPTINELLTLIDYSRDNPAINSVFQHTSGGYYWTSTSTSSSYALQIITNSGQSTTGNKGDAASIRCVREISTPIAINHFYNTEGDLNGNIKSDHGAEYDVNDSSVTVALVEESKNGVVAIDQEKGDFLYRPNEGYAGNDYFTYTITNADGTSNVAKVSIAVGFADATPPLTVKASVDKKKVTTGEEVHFTALADDGTGQMDSNDYVCTWKFGDGEKVDECDVTKTFDTPGNYSNFVRVITLTGKHAISGNIGVSVTEPKDANLDVVTSDYNVVNVGTVADEFSIFLTATDKSGNTINDFCNTYGFLKAVDSNGEVKSVKCTPVTGQNRYYRYDFKLASPNPNYVEDATVKICGNNNDNNCSTLKGLNHLTVIGTHFDLKKNSFKFANGSWNKIKMKFGVLDVFTEKVSILSELGKSAKAISDYFPNKKLDFYKNVGFYIDKTFWFDTDHTSDGLCYGMAAVSAANYNHRLENNFWHLSASNFTGQAAMNAFKNDINNHWNGTEKSIRKPYKPFPTNDIYNAYNKNNLDALQKIMYYFVGQDLYNDNNFSTWIGDAVTYSKYIKNDGTRDIYMYNLFDKLSRKQVLSILKEDQAVMMTMTGKKKKTAAETLHEVTLVQYINYVSTNYGNKIRYMVYDSNFPYPQKKIKDEIIKNRTFTMIEQWDNPNNIFIGRDLSSITAVPDPCYNNYSFNKIVVDVVKNTGRTDFANPEDAFHIYRHNTTPTNSIGSRSVTEQIPENSNGEGRSLETATIDNRYIEIMIVGGDVFSVQNSNGENVAYIEEGEKDGTNVVVSHSGAFTTLYLPVTDTYTVNAGKYAFYPFMEVLQRIPQSDGTVNIVNYDNVELAENDPTEVTFTVGVDNTDKTLHRTTAGNPSRDATSLLPAYDDRVEQTLTAPSNFSGLLKGATVILTWNNSTHPLFDHTVIVRKRGGEPTDIGDGETLYSGTGESVDDNTLDSNTYYYYAAYSVDSDGNVSAPSIIKIDTGTWGIEGMVTDAQNGNPVGGASVTLREANATSQDILRTALTDANGHYAFANVAEGNYTLAVSANLYRFDNPEHNISIPEDRGDVDFAGFPVPTVAFISGFESVDANATVKLRWLFRNLDTSETVSVDVDEGNGWQNVAGGVPVTQNVDYTAGSQVYYGAKLRLSLESDTAVNDIFTFNITDTASRFIERFFDEIYKRTPTQTEMTEWLQKLEDNDAVYVARAFYNSPEFGDLNLTNEAYVALLYKTLYGRLPAQSENERWLYDLSNGTSRETMFETLVASDKFQTQPSDTPPAPDCGYVVTPVTLEYDDTAHTGVLTVGSFPEGCTEGSWRSATTADWITLSGDTNGTGPGEWHLHFTIERNDDKNDRGGEIEVGNKTVVIDQAAKKINIMPVIMLLLQ